MTTMSIPMPDGFVEDAPVKEATVGTPFPTDPPEDD